MSMKPINYLFFVVIILECVSCRRAEQQTVTQFLESLPQVYPAKIDQFQKAGGLYFSHLGYQTIPLKDGSIVIPLRTGKRILQINQSGELMRRVARPGRGPGEVQDPYFLQQAANGEIVVYDQTNRKIIRFGPDLEFIKEHPVKPPEYAGIIGSYPMEKQGQYLIESMATKHLFDNTKSPEVLLSQYNMEKKEYGKSISMKDRPFAHRVIDGKMVGGREVRYSEN